MKYLSVIFLFLALILIGISHGFFNVIYENYYTMELETNNAAKQFQDEDYPLNKFIAKGGVKKLTNKLFIFLEFIVSMVIIFVYYKTFQKTIKEQK